MRLRDELKAEISENMRGFNVCHHENLKDGVFMYSKQLNTSIRLLYFTYGITAEIIHDDDGYISCISFE